MRICTVLAERLRAHHLLCSALYEGKGYSEGFVTNMDRITERLRSDEELKLEIKAEPDCLCEYCPHLTETGECGQDQDSVTTTDRKVLDALGLIKDEIYTYSYCKKQMQNRMNKEMFEWLCQNCSWKKKGICTWDKMKAFLNT